jgi:hypothetical protein
VQKCDHADGKLLKRTAAISLDGGWSITSFIGRPSSSCTLFYLPTERTILHQNSACCTSATNCANIALQYASYAVVTSEVKVHQAAASAPSIGLGPPEHLYFTLRFRRLNFVNGNFSKCFCAGTRNLLGILMAKLHYTKITRGCTHVYYLGHLTTSRNITIRLRSESLHISVVHAYMASADHQLSEYVDIKERKR